MMTMQMNMNQNMMGMSANQINYYNQAAALKTPAIPNIDNILFVADLPDEACEEDLANFFKAYNFNFAKVFHNVMKTHAFVTFISKEDADRARLELNGVKMTAKYANTKVAKPVRLCKFETRQTLGNLDGRANLLITNISKEVSPHGFYNMFRKFGDIYSCKLMVDYLGNSKGFGYVTYYNVNDADKAKSELHEKDVNGKLIKVIYLEYGRRTEKKKNNVYVKHIPKENFSNSDLESLFTDFGRIKSAVVLVDGEGKSKGFGFVCFENVDDADEANKQMNGKTIWVNLPPLYVNYAMKKSERLEHLQKKREEMFKMAQKMTIFVKIKDENSVKNDADFESQIRVYLKTVMQKDYEPKSIKIRFETKNAFVTMINQKDAEDFIKRFLEFSKENPANLFFNLYKSKVERISANSYFKKYNNFNGNNQIEVSMKQQTRYQTYNDFGKVNQISNPTEFPFSSLNQKFLQGGKGVRYNDFGDRDMLTKPSQQFPSQVRPATYNTYNNFNDLNMPMKTTTGLTSINPTIPSSSIQTNQAPRFDLMDEDEIGEFIYNFVERIYPSEASKITGMLMELDQNTRLKLLTGKPEDLANIIKAAYTELLKQG